MGWSDSFWLTVVNVALGVAVGALVAGVALEVLREMWCRWRAHHIENELDRDMNKMFGGPTTKR